MIAGPQSLSLDLPNQASSAVLRAAKNTASNQHALINLIRLVKSLEAKVNTEDDDVAVDLYQAKKEWESVLYAKALLEALRDGNEQSSSTSNTLMDLEKDLSNIERSLRIGLSSPLPTPPMNPALIALPMTPNPSNPPPIERKSSPPILQPVQTLSTPRQFHPTSAQTNQGVRKRKSRVDEYLAQRSRSELTGSEEGLLPLNMIPPKSKANGNGAGGREALLSGPGAGPGAGPGSGIGSAQLHEELGGQLADMSHRLKLNAVQFSTAMENEKSILENSQNTLENNLSATKSSKKHLSTVTSKGRSTTCLTLGVVILVIVLFVWTYMLIRFT
ncbi:uncharacterized protein I303_104540 [Kwoniella dejecticola CBS 10117]|uniref:Uncharacterized protein n=1 Tax=Kwoniella dejecticola CBS 10117 TaxID=1296121 RepID=A0A1A6A507_9TREE|nr:uncharacterized protein I303_04482 [Kwoniella dejecticola CBS 10117]OBR85150.1 hypothetical protein I303_04482 [Kwoniella dejecticola CBS 10117]